MSLVVFPGEQAERTETYGEHGPHAETQRNGEDRGSTAGPLRGPASKVESDRGHESESPSNLIRVRDPIRPCASLRDAVEPRFSVRLCFSVSLREIRFLRPLRDL